LQNFPLFLLLSGRVNSIFERIIVKETKIKRSAGMDEIEERR
jgi:hypothetical protein